MNTHKVKRSELEDIIIKSNSQYSAPADDMWHGSIIRSKDYYAIENEGFYVLDEGCLYDFYAESNVDAIFQNLVSRDDITKAFVPSYNPCFYDVAMKYASQSCVNTLVFEEVEEFEKELDLSFELVSSEDLNEMLALSKEYLGEAGEWLEPYYKQLIKSEGLYKFYKNGFVGFGEIRIYQGHANIGMNVSFLERKKGYGTQIITTLKSIANQRGYKALASTEVSNIGSIKTLEKCGFKVYHKIYEIKF